MALYGARTSNRHLWYNIFYCSQAVIITSYFPAFFLSNSIVLVQNKRMESATEKRIDDEEVGLF